MKVAHHQGWQRHIPALQWVKNYSANLAVSDLTAAMIVTLMLVPQALAYAMLAGLPAHVGLYASLLPLALYAVFGTSSTLAVGPVAVAALMTASAVQPYAQLSMAMGLQAALVLALVSGLFLLLAGLFRLGFLANFLSHPVIAGFIAAASLLIATSQLGTLMGISSGGGNMRDLLSSLLAHLPQLHTVSIVLSVLTLLTLLLARRFGTTALTKLGCSRFVAQTLTRSVPAILVVIGTLCMQSGAEWFEGVKTVGDIPAGLPEFAMPVIDLAMMKALALPALMIAIVGYVESISVAQKLGMQRRERVDPDQELVALGVANLSASVTAGMPVAGGVSRSVVNVDAGAQTPAAGLFTAVGMLLATYFLAGWLGHLPRLILSATIIVAVLSLFDIQVFTRTWQEKKEDFGALVVTFLTTLFVNVEWGISAGVLLSIGLHLYKTSRPHIAVVGQVPGTEHFRNIDRHAVEVCSEVITVRVDESLYFANAHYLEQHIQALVAENKEMKHLILMCSAVNDIDGSAMVVLEGLNTQLAELGIGFHLSEVKGPVMDHLKQSALLKHLNGKVFLTQFKAYQALACL